MNNTLDLTQSDIDRFWTKVDKTPTCWDWTVKPDTGYGRFGAQGRTLLAHRVAHTLAGRSIPNGLQVDHLCRNRRCVNPDHLDVVSVAENVLRGDGISARNARKTHCHRGHPLEGDNLYITPSGNRNCIKCQRQRVRDHRRRQVAA